MLHNLLIISGRGSIVLFRKSLTKSLNQAPNLVAGLLTAVVKLSTKTFGFPVSYLELDNFAISVVEDSTGDDGEKQVLRCILFHDVDDGELYGRMIGKEILRLFIAEYSQTLATVVLGRAAGVEGMFKSFGSRIRTAIDGSTQPLLRHLERTVGVSSAVLVREETSIFSADYPADTSLVADLQGLVHVADDALAVRGNKADVLSLGNTIRIHRLERASLVVVASNDIKYIVKEIEQAAWALQRLFQLASALQGRQTAT